MNDWFADDCCVVASVKNLKRAFSDQRYYEGSPMRLSWGGISALVHDDPGFAFFEHWQYALSSSFPTRIVQWSSGRLPRAIVDYASRYDASRTEWRACWHLTSRNSTPVDWGIADRFAATFRDRHPQGTIVFWRRTALLLGDAE